MGKPMVLVVASLRHFNSDLKKPCTRRYMGTCLVIFRAHVFIVKPLANRRVFSLTPGAFRASEHDLPAPSLPGLGVPGI